MTGLLTSAALAVLLGWTGFALAGLLTDPPMAVLAGLVVGVVCVVMLRDTVALRGLVAVLAPFGVMLPALALRHMGMALGAPFAPFATAELVVFLLAYVGFLMAAFGVLPVDLYRFGYAPVPVGVMVLVLCAYGAVSGNLFLPLVAVLAQAAWVMGWGSSNWFDHVTHVLLVPVVIVVLVGRLI